MTLDASTDKRRILMIMLHFNPVNLILKYMIINFENFTQCLILVHKFINQHNCEFWANPITNQDKNNKLRWYCFVTNETDTEDKARLEEKFIPTEEEIEMYKMLNDKAQAKHERKRARAKLRNIDEDLVSDTESESNIKRNVSK